MPVDRSSSWRSRLLSDDHGLAVVSVDGDRVDAANGPARALLGEHCVGALVDELFVSPRLRELLTGKDPRVAELEAAAGTASFAALVIPGESLLVGVSTCPAAREEQPSEPDVPRTRDEWTGGVAHDLRQPVSVISLAAELLLQRTSHELDRRGLERIRTAARHLNRMIGDLSEASLIESNRLVVEARLVDVAPLVDAAFATLAAEDAARFHLRASVVGEVFACVDPDRIKEVLGILLTNAVKYGQPGTEILVEVRPGEEVVELVVTNHGVGIASDQMPLLFNRFARARETRTKRIKGLGLGLYIARGIVEVHGGRIWAESLPGETTSFHFTLKRGLPASSRSPSGATGSSPTESAGRRSTRQ